MQETTQRILPDQQPVLPTDATGFEVIHIGLPPSSASAAVDAAAVSTVEPLNNSAHKIPNSLWSVFESSREQEDASTAANTVASTAANTAANTVHSASSHLETNVEVVNTESGINGGHQSLATIVDIEDLPKPDEHTSEVLFIEEIPTEASNDILEEVINEDVEEELEEGHKLPKAFDFGLPDVQTVLGDVQIHSFGLEQSSSPRCV